MDGAAPPLFVSPSTEDVRLAEQWLDSFVVAGLDGVVAKRLDSKYRPGEREMRKVKRIRTADCVVIGVRWAKELEDDSVGSLLLGLYGPDRELHQVGFTSGFSRVERQKLVEHLAPYRSGRSEGPPPGTAWFSRWNREKDMTYEMLRPELVVEVGFDQVTGHRIRHGARFVRWRPDKAADSCTFDQLDQPVTSDLERLFGDGPGPVSGSGSG
jgi:ATP-dependent DNA ligase